MSFKDKLQKKFHGAKDQVESAVDDAKDKIDESGAKDKVDQAQGDVESKADEVKGKLDK